MKKILNSTDKGYKASLNERIAQYGASTLLDDEILSVLAGIPIETAKGCIENYGLPEVIKYIDTIDLSGTQRKKLEMLYHFSKRVSISNFKEKPQLNSSSKSGEYFRKELQFMEKEVFVIGFLNSQNKLINVKTISEGTINEAHIYPREIVKVVLNNNANSVILAHNHPGGSLTPSGADIEVTKKIINALRTVAVSVIDHIIVADSSFMSFAEKGLLNL